jgi:RNA polymerase sigma factor (sigma-70 family)
MGESPSSQTSPTLLGRLGHDPTDQEAWSVFVRRYGPKIYSWCRRWGLAEADAEEVAQNVLAHLARKLRHFVYDPARSFRAWLRTVTRHAWSDFIDDRKRCAAGSGDSQVLELLQSVPARDDLVARLEEEYDRELLDEALVRVRLRVTPERWEVFRLTAIDGLSGAEVAQRLAMKVATVYTTRSKVQKLVQKEVRKLAAAEEKSS